MKLWMTVGCAVLAVALPSVAEARAGQIVPLAGANPVTMDFGFGSLYNKKLKVTYGKTVNLMGALSDSSSAPVAGRNVLIERRTNEPGEEYKTLALAPTGSDGSFSYSVKAVPSSQFRASFVGDSTYGDAQVEANLAVKGSISLSASPRSLRNGKTVTFSGKVQSAGVEMPEGGKTFSIEYKDKRGWRDFTVDSTKSNGNFTVNYTFKNTLKPTRFQFRAFVPGEYVWPFNDGVSPPVTVFVKP